MPLASDGKGNWLSLSQDGQWVPTRRATNPQTGEELVLDGTEWKPAPRSEGLPLPPPEPPPPPPSAVSAGLRGVVRGATMGFNDEIKGAISGVGGLFTGEGYGPAYERGRDAERALDTAADQAHPYLGAAGQAYGGVGGAVLGGAAAGAAGIARVAAPLNALLGRVPGAGAVARTVGTGAAGGGVAGFGEGQGGLSERLENAGQGAALGGTIGGVMAAGTRGGIAVGRRVGDAFGWRDAEAAAERQILRAMGRSGVEVDDAATRLAAAGADPVGLVDVGGRNTVGLGRVAANTPGQSMEAADQMVQMRRATRPDRLMNAGDEAFGGGSGTDVAEATAARRAQRQAEATPLYEEAFGQPANFNDAMRAGLEDPITRAGLARGLEIQRMENTARRMRGEAEVPTTDPSIDWDDLGVPRIIAVPNMRTLDAVKRGLDATLEDARDPLTGRLNMTERLRAVDDIRRTWVGLLDRNNPTYAEARAAWAGPSAQMEATDAGRTAFRTDRDIVAQRMQNSAPDVQDAYRLGAGRDFADRVSKPGTASGAAQSMLEDRQMQARLNSLLAPDARDALNARLRRETEMTAVERAVSPRAGSPTYANQAGAEDMANDPMGPWATALFQATQGQLVPAARTLGADVWRRGAQGINPATSDALANRLFATDPNARAAVVAALRNRLLDDQSRAVAAREVWRPVLQGVGVSSGLSVE